MANISALLEIIRTAHLGRDMRQALHDSIDAVNDDVETCGQTLGVSGNKLQLKRGSTVLSEVDMPSSVSNLDDLSDVTITSATTGQVLKWNGSAWVNGSGGDTVAVTQVKTSGEKIATINVNGTDTDLYASAGGGGGGGAVDSVNGMTGDVVLDLDDINDTNISSPSDGDVLVYNGTTGKWENGQGGGGTSDYTDLTNKPQINGVTLSGNKTASELGVKVNDNLLDNGWFTVNTTGFNSTSNTGDTSINDKWIYRNTSSSNSITSTSNGLQMTQSDSSARILQKSENNVWKTMFSGLTLTATVKLSDGTKYIGTCSNINTSTASTFFENNDIGIYLYNTGSGADERYAFGIVPHKSMTIKAVKLELGTESTLELDIEPNWEVENVKCGNGANKQDITSIVATGTTNNSGSTISNGSLFYLNGTLCKALSNIASGSAFTLNTNYKVCNLNEEITANNGGTRVDWSDGNTHIVPSDGYIDIYGSSASAKGYATVKGANDAILCQTSNIGDFNNSLFVRQGMKVQLTNHSGTSTLTYTPLE